MAVYTAVGADALAALLARYDVGTATAFKGIAEGVENSNFFVATTRGRYILTLYEKRVAEAELPYFLALMTCAADARLPVPRPIVDRGGEALQRVAGRPACLIEFLPGVSLDQPTPAHAHAAAGELGRLHHATAGFAGVRANALGPAGWRALAGAIGPLADEIAPGLAAEIAAELAWLEAAWPRALPVATIHADLFADNVLYLDGAVSGLIDFYFACTDLRAYDLAVMLSAWAFEGGDYRPDIAYALAAGYRASHPLLPEEASALTTLARGASLRFLLTRAYDWLNTPPGALVTRKDPLAFLARLRHFQAAA